MFAFSRAAIGISGATLLRLETLKALAASPRNGSATYEFGATAVLRVIASPVGTAAHANL
jgi:hypothetical protein